MLLPKIIVFTDLDGTLLDLMTYSAEHSAAALKKLQQAGIPVVFCSSKTRVEQEVYRQECAVNDPFIVENGSAILVPEDYFSFDFPFQRKKGNYKVIELGSRIGEIKSAIESVRFSVREDFLGYADLELGEVMQLTGLDEASAKRATEREYSETILKGDTSSAAFQRFGLQLARFGFSCVSGGKFHTIMAKGSNKGRAVKILADLYRRQFPHIRTVGIGDSANDMPMLRAVDKPYLVQKPDGSWQEISFEGIEKINSVGPKGWSVVADQILELV